MNTQVKLIRRSKRTGRPRRGFVLLMSVLLIALAGMILTALARHGLLVAGETCSAQVDLQRRWGTLFLSRVLLSDPERLVARYVESDAERRRALPLNESVELGKTLFRVTLDDESRKLNINRLRAVVGPGRATETLRRFGGGAAVHLKPLAGGVLGMRPFDSWGHLLEIEPTDDARRQWRQIRNLADSITCWGSAKVNIHRCRSDVLRLIGTLAAGPITADRIVALRRDHPDLSASELFSKLGVNQRKVALLDGWLADESDCYSLWIFAGGPNGMLDYYVRENRGSDAYKRKHFRW